MRVINQYGLNKKDIYNVSNGNTPYSEVMEREIAVKGCAVCEEQDDNGTVKKISYIVDKNGVAYGGTSDTMCRAVDNLIDYMTDSEPGEDVVVKIIPQQTNAGRTCFILNIV